MIVVLKTIHYIHPLRFHLVILNLISFAFKGPIINGEIY